jgi:hypothetical protein
VDQSCVREFAVSEDFKDGSAKASARRRLIRGAFATPAILTLHSGSAFAASSAASCLANQNASPISPAPVRQQSDDTYLRYQLWTIRRKANQNVVSSWIKGAQLTAIANVTGMPAFVGGSQWWQFLIGQNTLTGSVASAPPTYNATNQTFLQDGAWVVLRISAEGQLVGAGATDALGPGSAVAGSCWSSFVGAL